MPEEKAKSYKTIIHQESEIVEVIFDQNTTAEAFKAGSEEMLRMIKINNFSKVILDMEKTTFYVKEEDHKWFKENFVPRAANEGLRSIAFIDPGLFNTFSIANILVDYFPEKINFEICKNFEEASRWIIAR